MSTVAITLLKLLSKFKLNKFLISTLLNSPEPREPHRSHKFADYMFSVLEFELNKLLEVVSAVSVRMFVVIALLMDDKLTMVSIFADC
jgi:hypothetical protein